MLKKFIFLPIISIFIGCSNLNDPITIEEDTKDNVAETTGYLNDQYIPLVVIIYEHIGFTGQKRFITVDECDFTATGINFNDKLSSIIVHKGPNYEDYKLQYGREPQVTIYKDGVYRGDNLSFKVGKYDNVGTFNDKTSSIKFFNTYTTENPVSPDEVEVINKIYLVTRLYLNIGFSGYHIELLSTGKDIIDRIDNFGTVFDFNDRASSLTVDKGPNWSEKPTCGQKLWADSFTGIYQTYLPGAQVSVIGALNDQFSSSEQFNNK
jgi:hypothetical protein